VAVTLVLKLGNDTFDIPTFENKQHAKQQKNNIGKLQPLKIRNNC